MFWNTYNARPPVSAVRAPAGRSRVPEGFERYFD
jgi:hypothetical protein